jgi:transglutaminase-like putative cysteine protease
VPPRKTEGQAARLLKWVQGLYYVNEPGERLQDPLYTVQVGYGDCDDLAMLLGALCESLRIPWRFVLSGKKGRRTVRWIEGQRRKRARWAHIYVAIGDRPFRPTRWMFAEPTVRGVPLGWDVVSSAQKHGRVVLPELAGFDLGGDAKLNVKHVGSEKPFVRHVYDEVADWLKPRNLVPLIIGGLIIGVISDRVRKTLK